MRSTRFLLSATLVFVFAGCGAMNSNHASVMSNNLSGNFSAVATATMGGTMSSSMGGMTDTMSSPMLSFTFSMNEGPMMMTPAAPSASVSISNLNFTMGANCFDNLAVATATLVGAVGTVRSLTLQLSENGNMGMFSMAVQPNNNSATGNFALTGGHMVSTSSTPCMSNASGTASFSHL